MKKENSNSKKFNWDWSSFLTNLTAVILGIAITFMVQKAVDVRAEKKAVNESLNLIKKELAVNCEELKNCKEKIMLEQAAADFLIRYEQDYATAPMDSLYYFCNVPLSVAKMKPTTDALELSKNSVLLQKIKNQELALNIIQIYGIIDDDIVFFNDYNQQKQEMWQKADNEVLRALMSKNDFTAQELWTAIVSTSEGKVFLHEIPRKFYGCSDYDESIQLVEMVMSQIDEYIGKN